MKNRDMNPKTVIIFHHLGPYHLARIKSMLGKFPDIVVIELASRVNARDWERPKIEGFELITLVDDVYENIPPKILVDLVKEVLEKIRPDCVVTSGYSHPAMRAAAQWARKQGKISTVLLSESQYVDHKRNVFKEYLKKTWIKKYYDAAFVGGTSAASYLQNMGFPSKRIWRGYNVVDNTFFESRAGSVRENPEEIRKKLGLPARFFLYVGRFSEEKNLLRLLAGYKHYLSDAGNEAWGFVMAGSGPQENELREAAAFLGLKDIYWPGFIQTDDLPDYYALASGLILPSVRDPWGLVVNEAMASGLPVLVSIKCGCAFDLLVPGVNGKIFDPYSEPEISGAMKWLSSGGRDLQAMGNASKQIVSHYSPHNWSRALEDCISTIQYKILEKNVGCRYKIYSILGRPILAVPEAPQSISMLGWRLYHTFTTKRKVIQSIMQLAVLSGLDRVLSRSAVFPMEGLDPYSIEEWLEDVRSKLGDPALQPVIIWPPQRGRGRIYVHLVRADGQQTAFAKVSFDSFNDERLKKESRILGLLKEKGLKHCCVPAVLAGGTQKGHEYLVLEPLPSRARHISHTLKAYPEAFVEELAGDVRTADLNEIESFGWWQRFGEMAKGSDLFNVFKDELRDLIVSCSGLPVCRVHGDLSPANIVASNEGLWIFDWEESSENGPVLTDRIGFDLSVNAKQIRSNPDSMLKSFGKRYLQGAPPKKRRDVMAALAFRLTFEEIITGEYIRNWKRMGI